MTREEEIVQAAKEYEQSTTFGDIVLSELSRGVSSACGIGFLEGAVWADNHPNLTWEDIRKICLIAKNVHKYYGFWTQSVYEEIFNKFIKPEIGT